MLGSVAWLAAARAGWLLAIDEEDDEPDKRLKRRLLLELKNNLSGASGLAYRLIDGQFQWEHDPVLIMPDQLGKKAGDTKQAMAEQWLQVFLAGGPQPAAMVEQTATALGISAKTLRRAKQELGVVSRKAADGWLWELPPGPEPFTF